MKNDARLVEPFRPLYRPSGMWRSVVLTVGLAGVLAGCSFDPIVSRESVSKATLPRATQVRGMIVTVGGPAPGPPRPIPGARLRFRGLRESAVVVASKDGRFAFDVPPGRYRVEIIGHAPMANGTFISPIPDSVVVRRGGKPLRLVVSIK